MCFDYDEYAEFGNSETRTARKDYKCYVCGQPTIKKGDRHRYESGKFDSEFYAMRICRRCFYERVRIACHELDEGCDWDEAFCSWDDLSQYLYDSGGDFTPVESVPDDFSLDVEIHEMIRRMRSSASEKSLASSGAIK